MPSHLILGGARSGKSRHAEALAHARNLEVVVIATAQALDAEMAQRIARHQADRPTGWTTVEAPIALAHSLHTHDAPETCIVVDCITLWLSNLFGALDDHSLLTDTVESGILVEETNALLDLIPSLKCDVIFVANEIGLGLVPETPLGRAFRDEAGRLNQRLAQRCDRVTFIAAGLPLHLK